MHVFSAHFPAGPALVMLVKRAYAIHGSTLRALPEAPLLQVEAEYVPSSNARAADRLAQDVDLFAAHKPWTDVILTGAAWSSRGPVRMLDTGLRVGPLRKAVRVWGERTIRSDAPGRLRFSDPAPFTTLPLIWDHAYGGRDVFAEGRMRARRKPFSRDQAGEAGAIGYPRNPSGRGFFLDLDLDRLTGALAPSLEDPEDPVTPDRIVAKSALDWLDRPAAACYGPVDWYAYPRLAFWLGARHEPPARPVYEARRGLLRAQELGGRTRREGPDPRVYGCAPAGLGGARLEGKERISLWNLHPRQEHLEIDLPGERPQLLLEPPGCDIRELPALLQTVHIEPSSERITLTWTGTLPVAGIFPEEACRSMRRAARWQS
jgi:hypothetical protein